MPAGGDLKDLRARSAPTFRGAFWAPFWCGSYVADSPAKMNKGVLMVAQETWRFSMAVSTPGSFVASHIIWPQILCISGTVVQRQFCQVPVPTRLKPQSICSAHWAKNMDTSRKKKKK